MPPISPATCSPFCASRSNTVTLAPRRASSRAVASPSPDAAPVTTAAIPLMSIPSPLSRSPTCRAIATVGFQVKEFILNPAWMGDKWRYVVAWQGNDGEEQKDTDGRAECLRVEFGRCRTGFRSADGQHACRDRSHRFLQQLGGNADLVP